MVEEKVDWGCREEDHLHRHGGLPLQAWRTTLMDMEDNPHGRGGQPSWAWRTTFMGVGDNLHGRGGPPLRAWRTTFMGMDRKVFGQKVSLKLVTSGGGEHDLYGPYPSLRIYA